MNFTTCTEIVNFAELSRTKQAQEIAKAISQNVKKCGKGTYYIYDDSDRLWKEKSEDAYITYLYESLSKTSDKIKGIVGTVQDKRVNAVMDNLDKSAYVNDIGKRMAGLFEDTKFADKINNVKYFLPIKNNKVIDLK